MEEERNKVVVIGSGPAGLAAAAALRERGIESLILERRDLLSQKLLASGGGRCNFSNILPEEKYMECFGRNGKFMRNALRLFYCDHLLRFLEKQGVKAVLKDDFYYFPASGRAADIRDAFLRAAQPQIRTGSEVVQILKDDQNSVCGIRLSTGEEISCRKVILAGGSCAWKGLGSMAGLVLAEKLSHTIIKPLPAVAPLLIAEDWVHSLAGVTLPQGGLTLKWKRRTLETQGSILFTHSGLSGFPALDLAGDGAELCASEGKGVLYLDFHTGMDGAAWEKVLHTGREKEGTVFVKTLLSRYLVRSAAEILCRLCDCEQTMLCRLSSAALEKLKENLTRCPLTLTGSGPMENAMVMKGGVSLKEVDPAALESRLVKGLYFAGEILDLSGPCGGYNMQWAFSSGWFAGSRCAESMTVSSDK
ncbi:MAG: aminoacetone oxidase family FAD-binding enzyme [Lentisphaeria bacterium]|nr:aminoacetone oxidase family FAD-binding enzyme [Lentisphaeria bacterium]